MTVSPDMRRAVERVGETLEMDGVPRMPARVFAYLLIGDAGTYSARDLAEGLEVSPAAISGAVRYLNDTRLVIKERAPRTRGDLYRLDDGDVWATILRARLPILEHISSRVEEAISLLEKEPDGRGERGLARLHETWEFYEFARKDLGGMLERWEASKSRKSH